MISGASDLKKPLITLLGIASLVLAFAGRAFPRQHTVTFGPWMHVKLFIGPDEDKVQDMKVRTLNVDGRIKEFVTGDVHDVTDTTFVVRRAYRLNDALPEDHTVKPEWRWQRDGWLVVDRGSGRVSQLNLPEFDPFYSVASWYRDYVAYCGVSVGSNKLYAVVYQLGYRKPIIRENIGKANTEELPDTVCAEPVWQKQPPRVTFQPNGGQSISLAIQGRASELEQPPAAEEEKEPAPQ